MVYLPAKNKLCFIYYKLNNYSQLNSNTMGIFPTLRKALLAMAVMVCPIIAFAQNSGISGVVLDESGEPYIGATVMVRGTTEATITDLDGKFVLNLKEDATLVISYIGCETKTVVAYLGKPVKVVLKPDAVALDAGQVVAVGYGSQKKESVVGAVASIRPDELRVPVRSLSHSLAGNVAGLVALQSSGEPGKDDAQFWIRGIATFTGDPNPLVLVDGVERPLENVDPLEIESFSVLKDASATAVYGVRGANGVILINTRRGFDGPARIDVRYEQGFNSPSKRLSFVDAATRSLLFNEAVDATPGAPFTKYRDEEIRAMALQTDPELYPDVDWQSVLMKDLTMSEKVSANISGGGKFARYFTSVSFYNQEGQYSVNPGPYSWVSPSIGTFGANVNYTRYNFRSNVDMDITPTTTVSLGLQGNVSENMEPEEGGSASIYRDIINAAPNAFPVMLKDGKLSGVDGLNNPYNMLTQRGHKKTMDNALRANLAIDQDLKFITQGLSAKITYAYDFTTTAVDSRKRNISFYEPINRDEDGELVTKEWYADRMEDFLNYEHSSSSTRSQYAEATINYQHVFGGKHDVGALVMGFAKDYRYMVKGMNYMTSLPKRSAGLAARATYAYDNRYLVEANVGFNGSENFAKGKRMGVFPAIALGWVASQEPWLQGNKVLTWAKMRASVGQVGNDQIPSARFIYLATLNENAGGFSSIGTNYNQSVGGIGEGRMSNEDVTWEVATKYNVGLELGFLNCLRLNGDLFYELRENIFLSPQVSELVGLPAGDDYKPYANMGVMSNHGFEVSGEFQKQIGKDLYISARGNFTFTRNKVVSDGKYYAYPWQDTKGARYGLRLGYKAMHLFSEEELANMPDYYTQFAMDKTQLRPGDIRYEDINDDGKITEADQTWIGNPSMPEIVYGFGASLNWKGLDFSVLFQGAGNRSTYLSGGWYFQPFQAERGPKVMGNVMTMFLDRWTPENPDPYAFSPRLSAGTNSNNYRTSTWWLRDASYLRLKNVELGYALPDRWAKKVYADSLRVYLQGVNLLTFSKFYNEFWDPETGCDSYPMQRIIFLGLNLSF